MAMPDFYSFFISKFIFREIRNLKQFWETEKAKSQKSFISEQSRKTGGDGEEKQLIHQP